MRVNKIIWANSPSMTSRKNSRTDCAYPCTALERPFKSTDLGNMPTNYPIKSAKSAHPYKIGYFDMEKLDRIQLPEEIKEQPKPFEQTHALFKLDKYQQDAINAYTSGKTTLVSAPTGTGKTLIAEYAIKDSLNKGKKIIYLSPLKALSNEKYTEFAKLFGTYDNKGNLVNTSNVGLLTGDVSINPNAPVMVMTTEIYRNSLVADNCESIDMDYQDYDGVIYDEFHYLGDKDRGTVWEEAVMNTPSHMKQMMLSATASNADQIQSWVQDIHPRIKTHIVDVPESERHVPLREFVLLKDKSGELALKNVKTQKIDMYRIQNRINLTERQIEALDNITDMMGFDSADETTEYLKSLSGKKSELDVKRLAQNLTKAGAKPDEAEAISLILANKNSTVYQKELDNDYTINEGKVKSSSVIKLLNEQNMTPALFYIFSKKECEAELEKASRNSESLLTPEESKMVYDEVQKAKEKGAFLGSGFDDVELEALMKGFAVHHAGRLPAYKSLVESLARKGLVKVCFATETLIAGINMPFRTTVFTNLTKYDDEGETYISNSTFKQGAGRAGRRNKDILGNVVVIPHSIEDYEEYLKLSMSKDTSIKSAYKPSYASCLSDKTLNDTDGTVLRTLAAEQNPNHIDTLVDTIEARKKLLKFFECIEENEKGELQRTEKGEVAKKVFGVNEIFMTELLLDPKYLKDFTSTELIAICSCIADIKDENPVQTFSSDLKYLNPCALNITGLADTISNFELYEGISDTPIKFSTNLAPYIVAFANDVPEDKEGAIQGWCNIMDRLKEKELICHNGDFLRVINSTIDILKLVAELSPDKDIKDGAKEAIGKLRKPPVTDVINYELDKDKSSLVVK